MRFLVIGLILLAAAGCSFKHTWNVDSEGDREIKVTLDLSGLRGG